MGKESATVRRMGVVMACLSKGSKRKRGVEYRGIGRGGVGMVDAGVVGGRVAPEHLVVMVNGIIGSATDGKFAAEQFVDCGEAS